MERLQLHCNFSFNYCLSDSMHLIVQYLSETMEFTVITNKKPVI